MRRALVLVVLAGLLSIPATALANVVKFEFHDVSFPDGSTGTIYASVKDNHNNALTYCEYMSEPDSQFLGYYQEAVVTPADQVEGFCLDHFTDRQT